jgi:hypothetical protein
MLALKECLLLVTDKCIYEVQLADQIDPTRTNPNLPHNVRRKLFNHGIESEFICKVPLQANVLFQQNILSIDSARALELSLEALKELIAMDRCRRDFRAIESAAIDLFEKTMQQARSVGLPSVGDVDAHCKTFAQKAHQSARHWHRSLECFILVHAIGTNCRN